MTIFVFWGGKPCGVHRNSPLCAHTTSKLTFSSLIVLPPRPLFLPPAQDMHSNSSCSRISEATHTPHATRALHHHSFMHEYSLFVVSLLPFPFPFVSPAGCSQPFLFSCLFLLPGCLPQSWQVSGFLAHAIKKTRRAFVQQRQGRIVFHELPVLEDLK